MCPSIIKLATSVGDALWDMDVSMSGHCEHQLAVDLNLKVWSVKHPDLSIRRQEKIERRPDRKKG